MGALDKKGPNQPKFALFQVVNAELVCPVLSETCITKIVEDFKAIEGNEDKEPTLMELYENADKADYQCLADKADVCRYGFYRVDFEIQTAGLKARMQREKKVFIAYASECAPIKHKLVHAATKADLVKFCGAFDMDIQANDEGDIQREEWIKKISNMNNIKIVGTVASFEGTDVEQDN